MSEKIPRRDFWRSLFGSLVPEEEATGRASRKPRRRVPQGPAPVEQPPIPIRPPGALGERDFVQVCARCDACREACEPGILLRLGEAYGDAEGTPAFFPQTGACQLCPELPCAEACPSGALQAPAHWTSAAMGIAVLEPPHCLALAGEDCDACARACPEELEAIQLTDHGPMISLDACTGCGLCVEACPSEPKALRIRPGLSGFSLTPA